MSRQAIAGGFPWEKGECSTRVSLPPPETLSRTFSEPIVVAVDAASLRRFARRAIDLAVLSSDSRSLLGPTFSQPHDFGRLVRKSGIKVIQSIMVGPHLQFAVSFGRPSVGFGTVG
jgi:hypothetical protein